MIEDKNLEEQAIIEETNIETKNQTTNNIASIDPAKVNLVDLIDQPAWKTILLDLVQSEKMDPWNIDICALADKFLEKINSLERANLRVPANAILASAILLKTKSKALKLSSLEDLEEAQKLAELTEEERKLLEASIPELRGMRQAREARITLDELVQSIEVILNKSKAKNRFDKMFEEIKFAVPYNDFNIEEKMEEVFGLVQKRADSQGITLFSQLVNGNKEPVEIIQTFIPLLFLANKGKLNLWQEEFWQEIFISIQK
jgi:segregation and condensation protein A